MGGGEQGMHERHFRGGATRPFEPRDRLVRARLQQMHMPDPHIKIADAGIARTEPDGLLREWDYFIHRLGQQLAIGENEAIPEYETALAINPNAAAVLDGDAARSPGRCRLSISPSRTRWSPGSAVLRIGFSRTVRPTGETLTNPDWERPPMRRTRVFLSLLVFAGFIGSAGTPAASCELTDPVPCKKIRIYNNNAPTGATIYAFFESFIQKDIGTDADLWMQAYFKITDWDQNFLSPRKFATARLRRRYVQIGNDEGIAPGGWVEIALPFYTQLLETTADNLGKIPDQYINWWNSGRIVFFDSIAAYHSVKVTNSLGDPLPPGGGLPPPPVKYLAGAAVPSCVSSNGNKCTIPLFENALQPLDGIPFQLQEYTFAAAEGPPLNKTLSPPTRTKIDLTFVNYNVSSLDSVFLPVAMGPLTKAGDSVNIGVQPPVPVPYVGTALSTVQFRQTLEQFTRGALVVLPRGDNWPFYIPAYYDDEVHPGFPSSTAAACSLAPFPTDITGTYHLPKIPGAFNVLTASYLGAELNADGKVVFPPVPQC